MTIFSLSLERRAGVLIQVSVGKLKIHVAVFFGVDIPSGASKVAAVNRADALHAAVNQAGIDPHRMSRDIDIAIPHSIVVGGRRIVFRKQPDTASIPIIGIGCRCAVAQLRQIHRFDMRAISGVRVRCQMLVDAIMRPDDARKELIQGLFLSTEARAAIDLGNGVVGDVPLAIRRPGALILASRQRA